MESPLEEMRHCRACPSGFLAPADPHLLCYECLGRQHAIAGPRACSCYRKLPRVHRQQRADFFSSADQLALTLDESDEEQREFEEDAMEEEHAAPVHTLPLDEAFAGRLGFSLLCRPVSYGLFGSLTTVTQRLKRLEEEKV
ncbi:hypothetical protein ABVT39_006788 [Epinephelus coioides]